MTTSRSKRSKPSRVLGARTFAAITAVEGLELAPASRARLNRMAAEGLPRDERRNVILQTWRSSRPRGGSITATTPSPIRTATRTA